MGVTGNTLPPAVSKTALPPCRADQLARFSPTFIRGSHIRHRAANAQRLADLGVGPKFHGLASDVQTRDLGYVVESIPDTAPNAPITRESFSDLERILGALTQAGYRGVSSFEFSRDSEGRISLKATLTTRTRPQDLNPSAPRCLEEENVHRADFLRQAVLLGVDRSILAEYAETLQSQDEPAYLSLRREIIRDSVLSDLRPFFGMKPRAVSMPSVLRASEFHTHLTGIVPFLRSASFETRLQGAQTYSKILVNQSKHKKNGKEYFRGFALAAMARSSTEVDPRLEEKAIARFVLQGLLDSETPLATAPNFRGQLRDLAPGIRDTARIFAQNNPRWKTDGFWASISSQDLDYLLRLFFTATQRIHFQEPYALIEDLIQVLEINEGNGSTNHSRTTSQDSGGPREYQHLGITYAEISVPKGYLQRNPKTRNKNVGVLAGLTRKLLDPSERRSEFEGRLRLLQPYLSSSPEQTGIRGIDVIAPEGRPLPSVQSSAFHEFVERLEAVVMALDAAAARDGAAKLLRYHIGEGPALGALNPDWNPNDRTVATENIEVVLTALEAISKTRGKNFDNGLVVVRLAHFTAATPEQLQRAKGLGLLLDFCLTSNRITGAVPPRKRLADPPKPSLIQRRDGLYSPYDNHPLLLALFHEVPFLFGTDGPAIFRTTIEHEVRIAYRIIDDFRRNRTAIPVARSDGQRYETYGELSPEERDRFDRFLSILDETGQRYLERVGQGAPVR